MYLHHGMGLDLTKPEDLVSVECLIGLGRRKKPEYNTVILHTSLLIIALMYLRN